MSKLLARLKKFYETERQGLGHYQDELVELAYDLLDFVEMAGPDSNAGKDYDETVEQLRDPEVTAFDIDDVVNRIHQDLINRDDSLTVLDYIGNDVTEYLLNRENPEFWANYDKWVREEWRNR